MPLKKTFAKELSILTVALATLTGCASAPQSTGGYAPASNKAVLLVTAENMNAHASSDDVNRLMRSEVAAFAESLKKNLEATGRQVTLREFGTASEKEFSSAIAGMSPRPGLLVQAYWSARPGAVLSIEADVLKIQYASSTSSVRFTSPDRQTYLSIGPSAKPSDTPQNHAVSFSQHLNSAYGF